MTIDDSQLDAWLRDLDIPRDLHTRLLQLPDSLSCAKRPSRRRLAVAIAVSLAMAASVSGILVSMRLFSRPMATPTFAKTPIPTSEPSELFPRPVDSENAAWSEAIADIRARSRLIDRMLREASIEQLTAKLEALSSDPRPDSLESQQRASLIVCIADQSALQLGADPDWVERDMTRVIAQYPNTEGAKLAQQFIAQDSFQ